MTATIPTCTREIELPDAHYGLDPARTPHLIRNLAQLPPVLRAEITQAKENK